MKKYKIILADPPWRYDDKGCNGNADEHYETLSDEDIYNFKIKDKEGKRISIKDITDEDCILFIWGTYPKLPEVLKVIKAWGFEYKSIAFQWVKLNKTNSGYFYGLGRWTRGNTEPCFLAVKGKPKRISKSVNQLIFARLREHSRKPDEVRAKILKLVGDLPKIELFGRERIEGWDSYGDELSKETQKIIK